MQTNIETIALTNADIYLDWDFNPSNATEFQGLTNLDLREYVGIIPEFFADAVLDVMGEHDGLFLGVRRIADRMNERYQFGGFRKSFGGDITADGIYRSEYREDPDLFPIVQLSFETKFDPKIPPREFRLYVYRYGIVGLIEPADSSDVLTGRFD